MSPAWCVQGLEVIIVSVRASLAARDKGATSYGKELPYHVRDE